MFLTHYVQYIRPIMRTYRLRYQVRGYGVHWEIWLFTKKAHSEVV